ncbi:uncharacterized protein Z519_12790 [Cladophialophora bantiana CBS 173.52]|uniref:Uncharacterized protein n=1 Tax=Cladophialophora bantiana (strain ATCC 10958 / CBS 173.52 / CDC B-1940 / NIH 8579) TaxID=1442370 RepID=A0A0D2E917_CLAB1|nr:uncharacterized protein Z519_12790 [Cladophialophora bantiana CBS 173.52]KIW86606.1 hypothetical protein Z519_12790 [Cladophialophora bantiana CBS 173.52]
MHRRLHSRGTDLMKSLESPKSMTRCDPCNPNSKLHDLLEEVARPSSPQIHAFFEFWDLPIDVYEFQRPQTPQGRPVKQTGYSIGSQQAMAGTTSSHPMSTMITPSSVLTLLSTATMTQDEYDFVSRQALPAALEHNASQSSIHSGENHWLEQVSSQNIDNWDEALWSNGVQAECPAIGTGFGMIGHHTKDTNGESQPQIEYQEEQCWIDTLNSLTTSASAMFQYPISPQDLPYPGFPPEWQNAPTDSFVFNEENISRLKHGAHSALKKTLQPRHAK